jgi:predicted HicB family RNase H-like nuclease
MTKVWPRRIRYTYRVVWSEEDAQYVGLCVEFPSLSWLAPTPEEALRGIHKTVTDVVKDMKASGERVPASLCSMQYSGKFVVRVPPELHRRLAVEAAEEKVSLNRLVSAKLSQHCPDESSGRSRSNNRDKWTGRGAGRAKNAI